MAILNDGDILHAEAFNNKQDKLTVDSSITLKNLTASNEIKANNLIVTKIVPSTTQQINLSTAELKAIKSIELNDGTNDVTISPSADGIAFSKALKVNTPTEDTDAANKQYVDAEADKKQDTLTSGTTIKTINGETLLGAGDISISASGIVDDALSATSTNPVQNKVINSALSAKQDTIKSTDTLTIAGLRASNNSMTLFNDSCVVSMTDDALIINFI